GPKRRDVLRRGPAATANHADAGFQQLRHCRSHLNGFERISPIPSFSNRYSCTRPGKQRQIAHESKSFKNLKTILQIWMIVSTIHCQRGYFQILCSLSTILGRSFLESAELSGRGKPAKRKG